MRPERTSQPLVSVIIVNYNGRGHLDKCLPSVSQTAHVSIEIIVVDNGSSDDSVRWLGAEYPDVRVLELGENVGFGEGNRRGVEAASAEYVAFLNSDTTVDPQWLKTLVDTLETHQDAGAACSLLRFMEYPHILNARGGGMTRLGFGFDRDMGMLAEPLLAHVQMQECEETFFPTCAAALMRKKTFLECGGFDREFFMYHEDVDLGWRLWLSGYRVVVCRDSVVYHRRGGTTVGYGGSQWSEMMGARHNVRSLMKNYGFFRAVAAVTAIHCAWFARLRLSVMWESCRWNTRHLLSTLKERRAMQRKRSVRDTDLTGPEGLMDPRGEPVDTPMLPLRDKAWGLEHWIQSPVLLPAEDSALGRLGGGWLAFGRKEKSAARKFRLAGECYLRVRPGAEGTLSAEIGVVDGTHSQFEIALSCNGAETVAGLEEAEPTTVSAATRADTDGLLHVKLVAHAARGTVEKTAYPEIPVSRLEFVSDAASSQGPYGSVAVVIPTCNRTDSLRMVLEAIAGQTRMPDEVIVVDDGSAADVSKELDQWRKNSALPFEFRFLRQENAGPGAARNRGVTAAKSDLVMFLGDDTVPEPDWIEAHLEKHKILGLGFAVVGYTDWHGKMRTTPFLRYINRSGDQFGYGLMADGRDVPFTCFYTSNISIARELLVREPFDPAFKDAGWEDVELGYRLSLCGVRIVYHKAAKTSHYHPMRMTDFLRRQTKLGRAREMLIRRYPELGMRLFSPGRSVLNLITTLGASVGWLSPLFSGLDYARIPLPRVVYRSLLTYSSFIGTRNARAEGRFSCNHKTQ